LLVEYFVNKYCDKSGTRRKTVSSEAMDILRGYGWPGNVRELENTIERAILLNRSDRLEPADLPDKLTRSDPVQVVGEAEPANPTLESIEKAYIHYVMSQTDGKKSEAARILGIDTSTLYRKIQRYELKNDTKSKKSGKGSRAGNG
jgi:DNA-binding NtrC family response regulator